MKADYREEMAHVLHYAGLTQTTARACVRAMYWRGGMAGFLKRSTPGKSDPEARGAWLAMMTEANPMKVSFDDVLMLPDYARAIYDEVSNFAISNELGIAFEKLDYDRTHQEAKGVV